MMQEVILEEVSELPVEAKSNQSSPTKIKLQKSTSNEVNSISETLSKFLF
jgi:hypothetical protein